MPLYLLGTSGSFSSSEDNHSELLQIIYSKYKKSAIDFCNESCKAIGSPSEALLYVHQREMALISYQNDVSPRFIGSDDATTCHIIAVLEPNAKIALVAHLDGSDTVGNIKQIDEKLSQALSSRNLPSDLRLELYIVGGFLDERKLSEELSRDLVSAFSATTKNHYNLKLACISKLNTRINGSEPWPCFYGFAVDIENCTVFPAEFRDKGPELELRNIRCFTGENYLLDIFDDSSSQLTIPPFSYRPLQAAEYILRQPDSIIREYLSTTPLVERPYFEASVRASIEFSLKNPNADTYFGGKAKKFVRNSTNHWIPL